MIEVRVIRVDGSCIDTAKILCPFCGKDNLKTNCNHLDKIEKPSYKNSITGKFLGNFSYWFIKQ